MKRAALALYFSALAVWFGGMVAIANIVAPVAFREAPSRQEAGKLVGATLRSFGRLEIACGVVALAACLVLRRGGKWERVLRPAAAILMLGIALFQVGWVYGAAAEAREQSQAERFATLHSLSVALMSVNLILGGAQLVTTSVRLKSPDGA